VKRGALFVTILALAFTSPAAAANIVVMNASSLPDTEIADALPTFQRALHTCATRSIPVPH